MKARMLFGGALMAAATIAGACNDGAAPPAPTSTANANASPSVETPATDVGPSRACEAHGPARIQPLHPEAASGAIAVGKVDAKREIALLADEDQRAIHVFDATTLEELGVTATTGRPRHVRVLADGRIAVTERDPERVAVYELKAPEAPLAELCATKVASDPYAIAEAPSGIVVSSGYGAALSVLDRRGLDVRRVVHLAQEPRGVVIDPSGGTAYVTHAILGRVSVVDLASDAPAKEISLAAGRLDEPTGKLDRRPRQTSQAFAIVGVPEVDGHPFHLLVPGTTVDSGTSALTVTPTYGGGRSGTLPIAPMISTVDVRSMRTLTIDPQSPTEPRDGNCLLPRGAVLRGESLYVACLDLGEVVEFDASVVDPSALVVRRYRVPVGPSALAVTSADEILVWSEIDRALSRIDPTSKKAITLDESRRTDDVAVTATPWVRDGFEVDPVIARGRFLFHTSRDHRLSFFRACASCHPDGRADGLAWTSPDGLRQTPMLAGRLEGTAPFGWNGDHETLEVHVMDTAQRLGGSGLFPSVPHDKADLDALLAYVKSLPAPAVRELPSEGELVSRGGKVFQNVCSRCHTDGVTDQATHDVGSIPTDEQVHRPAFKAGKVDTPSLVRIAGTAPYFHDGRFATLEAVVGATDRGMFDPDRLDEQDKRALVAYLETL